MKLIRFPLLFCCFCTLLLLPGCSRKPQNPDGRLDVSGTITLNGGPFEKADMRTIIFDPLDDPSSGISSTTFDLATGQYLCTMQDALSPGRYRVKIIAQALYDKRTNKPVGPDFGQQGDDDDGQGYWVPLIPPTFNAESTLEFEVVSGKKNVFDYDVVAEVKLP